MDQRREESAMTEERPTYYLDAVLLDPETGNVYTEGDPVNPLDCSKCRQPLRGLEGFVWIDGELYHRECAGWTP